MHLSSENHTKVALDQTIVIVIVILFIFISLDLNKRMYAVQTVKAIEIKYSSHLFVHFMCTLKVLSTETLCRDLLQV